jgi:glycosyl transferase family 2
MARSRAEVLEEEQVVEAATRHVCGPEAIAPAPDECVVVCLVRNGRSYVDGFLEHHLRLGAAHVVFLDNGSTDGTREQVAGRDRVSVFSCALPYKLHKLAMKRWLIRRFARGGWGLCVDADEHFDYPASARVPLRSLLRYLTGRDRDAMPALLLDLFPAGPLRASWDAGAGWRKAHEWYEAGSVKDVSIAAEGMEPIRLRYGGVRSRLGAERVCLTKFPLVRDDGRVRFLENDAHVVSHAKVADVSGVLLHYKFAPCFPARIADALEHGQYYQSSSEYRGYDEALRRDPDLTLWSPDARRYRGAEDPELASSSDDYRAWVEEQGR